MTYDKINVSRIKYLELNIPRNSHAMITSFKNLILYD